jgi:hypothetical protein
VEVVGAVFVLLVHPVGRPLAALLLLLVLATGLLVRVHTHRLVRETDLRLLHTGRLLEELAGARTRRVQDPVTDDPRLRAYQSALAASDRTTALLSVGPAPDVAGQSRWRHWRCPSWPRTRPSRSWPRRSAASCSRPPGCGAAARPVSACPRRWSRCGSCVRSWTPPRPRLP